MHVVFCYHDASTRYVEECVYFLPETTPFWQLVVFLKLTLEHLGSERGWVGADFSSGKQENIPVIATIEQQTENATMPIGKVLKNRQWGIVL